MNYKKPLLSVIIPALSVDVELRRCIDSVRVACGEENDRCELILVAPSNKIDIAKSYLHGVSIFVAESKTGIYSAMNDGFLVSSGRYVFFLGKDDVVLPQFSMLLDAIERRSVSAAFYDVYWGSNGVYKGKPSKWRILYKNLCHQGIIYSHDTLDALGPYLRKMRVQADHLVNIRLLWDKQFSKQVFYFPQPLVFYAADGFSSVTKDHLFWRLYPIILRRYVSKYMSLFLVASRCLRGKNK